MGIQIWDQISNARKLSKVKLHCAFSLQLGLKVVKIAWNVVKVGVHSYLPNAHLNLWSNFNSKKLVKSETPSCAFTKIGVKEGENSSKHHEGSTLIYPTSIRIYDQIFNSEKLVKSETSSCIFSIVRLKAGPNSLKHYKIWRAHLYIKWVSKSMIKFNSGNLVKSKTPSCGFAKVWLKGGKKSFEHH